MNSITSTRRRSIRLFLADGTADGLIMAEVDNWTLRARLSELLKRSEASRTGTHILTGPDPDRPGGNVAYVG